MFAVAVALVLLAIGLGAFSALVFTWQWIFGPPNWLIASFLSIAVFAGCVALLLYLIRKTAVPPTRLSPGWIVLAGGVIFAAYWTAQNAHHLPHGGFDAWMTWNADARFLYRGGSNDWRHIFDPAKPFGHVDYPLMLPGLIDGFWIIVGGERPAIPASLAVAFALLPVGILGTAVSALSPDDRGPLAAIILLATPSFLATAGYQYADLPLALYLLTTVVLLTFAAAWPQVKTTLLILAGLSAGLAAWTKNEGLLFVAVILCVQFALAVHQPSRRTFREIGLVCIGLAPITVLIVAFRILLVRPNEVVADSNLLAQIMLPGKYMQIAAAFVEYARSFGDAWDGGIHPFLMVAIYLLLYPPLKKRMEFASLMFMLVPVLMLAGYFVVYLISPSGPSELRWYIDTSLSRLFLQIWPISIFVVACDLSGRTVPTVGVPSLSLP